MFADETRPILLVTGCQKYREYLTPAIRRFTRPDWRTIGIVGGAATTTYDPSSGILSLAVPDNYESLPTKIQAAVAWVAREFPAVPGLFKTDEDIVFDNLSHLADAIREGILSGEDYWGTNVSMCRAADINTWRIQTRFEDTSLRPKHQQAIYCFGAGYWLSKTSMVHISSPTAAAEYQRSCLEDVCTGYVLNQQRIFPKRAMLRLREVPRGPELLAAK
jgi:hypothetical protein